MAALSQPSNPPPRLVRKRIPYSDCIRILDRLSPNVGRNRLVRHAILDSPRRLYYGTEYRSIMHFALDNLAGGCHRFQDVPCPLVGEESRTFYCSCLPWPHGCSQLRQDVAFAPRQLEVVGGPALLENLVLDGIKLPRGSGA